PPRTRPPRRRPLVPAGRLRALPVCRPGRLPGGRGHDHAPPRRPGRPPPRPRHLAPTPPRVPCRPRPRPHTAPGRVAEEDLIAPLMRCTQPHCQGNPFAPAGTVRAAGHPEVIPEFFEILEVEEPPDLDGLRTQAEKLGIKVDKRWGADRLAEEI